MNYKDKCGEFEEMMGVPVKGAAQQRNEYIDFLRGIGAVGIIAIHTAFWSGQSYTPPWFWNLTLFLDVPIFFYLSGWGSSYRKNNIILVAKSLLSIWHKWVFFVSILAIFCFVSKWSPASFQGVSDIGDLANNYMFNVSIPGFCVVAGSIWFMPIYAVVVFVNSVILTFIQKSDNKGEAQNAYMWLLLALFVWISFGKYFLGLDITYFCFYGFFWMMGYQRRGKANGIKSFLAAILLCVLGIYLFSAIQGIPLYDIQSAKFPPTLKYGSASMISILIAKFMEQYISKYNKVLVHIGKNAIFYYFGQGVGSSLSYSFISVVSIEFWPLKWLLTFMFNVAVTTMIAEFLALFYRKFCDCIRAFCKDTRVTEQ